MPFDFPMRLTEHADEDARRLWEWAWKLTERLNLSEEALAQKGASDNDLSKT